MDELQRMAELAKQINRRMGYAMMQLDREAKFKHRSATSNHPRAFEDDRFFRAYDALTDIRDGLDTLTKFVVAHDNINVCMTRIHENDKDQRENDKAKDAG